VLLKEIGRVITNNQRGAVSALCRGTGDRFLFWDMTVSGPRKWTTADKKISIPLLTFHSYNEFLIYVGFITIAMTVEVSSV
jgi:hypothetical protein